MLTLLMGAAFFISWALSWRPKEDVAETTKGNNQYSITPNNKPVENSVDKREDKRDNDVHEKEGYQNPAFTQTDDTPVFVQPLKESRGEFGKPRQSRKVSELSEVFRIPSPDDKCLSEMVIEEYDNKSKTLRNGELPDFGGFRSEDNASDMEEKSATSVEEDQISTNIDNTNTTSQSLVVTHSTESLPQNEKSDDAIKRSVSNENTKKTNEEKSMEWREKLKRDLLDEDEEFIDESTDDDDDDVITPASRVNDAEDKDGDKTEFASLDAKMKQQVKPNSSTSSSNKISSQRPIVLDNGSYCVKGGWAGEFAPISSVRNVIGHWRAEASEAWQEALGSEFIGETAIQRHSTLALENPIKGGKILNWKALQQVWSHLIGKDMESDVSQHPVLISEPATVDKKQREKMVEILIETLRVPGVCLRPQAVLCALSSSHKVGLVINSGYEETEIVPVYESYQLQHATVAMPVGGRHITEYLARLVQREQGITFTSVPEMEIINDIKERYATVDSDRCRTSANGVEDYILPDGRVMGLGKEPSQCTEPMFNPGLVGKSTFGLPHVIKQTIDGLDPDIMKECNNNILLAGGNSKVNGLHQRLQNDINELMEGAKVKLYMADNNGAWIGGSIIAEQSNFHNCCVTEDLYFENGAKVIHRL